MDFKVSNVHVLGSWNTKERWFLLCPVTRPSSLNDRCPMLLVKNKNHAPSFIISSIITLNLL